MSIVGDVDTSTGMTDAEVSVVKDVTCSIVNAGYKIDKSIVITNTMADTSFVKKLKGKSEFLRTLTGSVSDMDKISKVMNKSIKSSILNDKSGLYDIGTNGKLSGVQYNLSTIPGGAVVRKLVDLAIDHSSTTMADYEKTIKDNCNGVITSTGTMVVPAGFIDVNEKGNTMLNLFRYNGN